jgi:ribosomal protein S18 acetylase RimI-like enzyme
MNNQMKTSILIDENITLKLQSPEVFSKYLIIYHGQKYSHYYFRSSPSTLLEKARFLECGYFIYIDEKKVGGVFLKPNFMTDLFLIPPFHDYEGVAIKLLRYLEKISQSDKPIVVQEVIDSYVPYYLKQGLSIYEEGHWMIRATEPIKAVCPDEYLAMPVTEEDESKIAEVILSAYEANPHFKNVDTMENYIKHVHHFVKDYKDNDTLYNSSKKIVHKKTNEIVGSCLHMEFEGYPLIMSLAVKPDHQGKGLGRFLLNHSISYSSKGYPATRLYVFKENPAIHLYESVGFVKNGTLVDLHLMKK